MENHKFWQCIRDIAREDDSVDPGREAVEAALKIFEPTAGKQRFFELRPSYAGLVRRASGPRKLVYELDEGHFVQIEQTVAEDGVHLSGFASGVEDTRALLFGEESVFEAPVRDGEFEFLSIPCGCYDMAFDREGESLWIPKLVIGETKETK